jgi:glycosyltransferase involved in cell wall biosynthesis
LSQGLADTDYEVIVINDGSTDNGPAIVEQYCNKYPQFRLVNQANGGVGSARNRGIGLAQGDYIYFVDADDWLANDGMKVLRDKCFGCDYIPDIVVFRFSCIYKYCDSNSMERLSGNIVAKYHISQEYMKHHLYPVVCWKSIISRMVIINNEIRFTKHIVSEDGLFMLRIFLIQDLKIMDTDLNIYRYCIRMDSAMNSLDGNHIKTFIYDFIDVHTIEEKMLSDYPHIKAQQRGFAQWHIMIKLLLSTMSYNEIKQILDLAISHKIYPIASPRDKYRKCINMLYKHPLLVYLLSKSMWLFYPLHKKLYNYAQSRYLTLKELLTLLKKNLHLKDEACLLSK